MPLFLLFFALLLAGCKAEQAKAPETPEPAQGGARAAGRLDRSQAGTPAPDAEFESPEGEAASFADFRGKPLLVNLWATWCAPCVAEMPTLDALARRDQRIEVLAVSQDLNGQEKVDAFFAKRKFEMLEPYLDPELILMTQLGISTLPTTILYDAEGREVWRMTGMEDWTAPRAAALIAEAEKT